MFAKLYVKIDVACKCPLPFIQYLLDQAKGVLRPYSLL